MRAVIKEYTKQVLHNIIAHNLPTGAHPVPEHSLWYGESWLFHFPLSCAPSAFTLADLHETGTNPWISVRTAK